MEAIIMRKKLEQYLAFVTTSPVCMTFFLGVLMFTLFSGLANIIPRTPCLIIVFVCLAYFGLLAIAWYRLSKKIKQFQMYANRDLLLTEKYQYFIESVLDHARNLDYSYTVPSQKWITLFDVWLNTLVNNVNSLEVTIFDIASCFIFAFLECDCSDEDFQRVFHYAETMIQIPKTYIAYYNKRDELILILNSEEFNNKATFMMTTEESEAAMDMCRIYFLNPKRESLLELSGFLYALHYMNRKKK